MLDVITNWKKKCQSGLNHSANFCHMLDTNGADITTVRGSELENWVKGQEALLRHRWSIGRNVAFTAREIKCQFCAADNKLHISTTGQFSHALFVIIKQCTFKTRNRDAKIC